MTYKVTTYLSQVVNALNAGGKCNHGIADTMHFVGADLQVWTQIVEAQKYIE